jgi:hypothetical protein
MNKRAKLTAAMVAKKWRKGQPSPNPSGRPKRQPIEEALLKTLTPQEALLIAKAIIKAAKRGNVKAFDSIAERVDGKVPQPVALTGGDSGPMVIEIRDIGGGKQ